MERTFKSRRSHRKYSTNLWKRLLTLESPSKLVLSAVGKEVQKKLWDETIALFKKEAPTANIDSILL